MNCSLCGVAKLSTEFPPIPLSDHCKHALLACMRCSISHVEKNKQCPNPECKVSIQPDANSIKFLQRTLEEIFPEYTSQYTAPVVPAGAQGGIIHVSVLNGDSTAFPYSSAMTILDLKARIKTKMGYEVQKQKLLYKDKELKTHQDNGSQATLGNSGVTPNSTIHLVVLLYRIPDNFDKVVFDLHWGYPSTGKDYLDASCLVFNGIQFVEVIDYCHRFHSAIRHSGDVMDNYTRTGHHKINVSLKNMPPSVTHLFFTLSAWDSPNISRYPNPSLKFYEESKPGKDLCKTTFTHAKHSQAVVMCSLSRKNGVWEIFESGKLSAGNASNYTSLQSTIRQLISQGY